MKPACGLNCLFLDLNSYFASVEQQECPWLRGRPVAVVPMETDSTCAIAASYEAKAYGIKTGTKIYEAKKLCPDLVLVLARHEVYAEYHTRIIEEINRHIPIDKVCSIDEVACRLMGSEREPDNALSLARQIKEGLAKHVGPYLKSSIGLASNQFLAKLATDLQKPDGLVILRSEALPGCLSHLSLMDLPGINRAMNERLWRANIGSIEALWNADPKHVRQVWGGVQGERFWYALHGYEIPNLETQKRTIGHSRVLAPEIRPQNKAHLAARSLLLKAAKRLRRHGLSAGALTLKAKLTNKTRFETTARFPYTCDSFILLQTLDAFWSEFVNEFGRGATCSKVAIHLHRLHESETIQPSLFNWFERDGYRWQRRREGLWDTLDQLNRRFGRDAVTLASQLPISAHYPGAKIAFTRIPEMEEFGE